jgi:hypothetical protein
LVLRALTFLDREEREARAVTLPRDFDLTAFLEERVVAFLDAVAFFDLVVRLAGAASAMLEINATIIRADINLSLRSLVASIMKKPFCTDLLVLAPDLAGYSPRPRSEYTSRPINLCFEWLLYGG